MKIVVLLLLFLTTVLFCSLLIVDKQSKLEITHMDTKIIKLPTPKKHSQTSLEEAIALRRSVREFTGAPISLDHLSQILWAAQGITDTIAKFRSAPSAGALYPLEIYIVASNVFGLPKGIFKYRPNGHELVKIKEGDFLSELMKEALWQGWIAQSSVVLVYTAIYERTTWKYGERGRRYVYMEVGHSAQNVCLQVESLGLGTTTVGAFNDDGVKKIIGMEKNEIPLYLLPIGVK